MFHAHNEFFWLNACRITLPGLHDHAYLIRLDMGGPVSGSPKIIKPKLENTWAKDILRHFLCFQKKTTWKKGTSTARDGQIVSQISQYGLGCLGQSHTYTKS